MSTEQTSLCPDEYAGSRNKWKAVAIVLAVTTVIWSFAESVAGLYVGFSQLQLNVIANAGNSLIEIIAAVLVLLRLRMETGIMAGHITETELTRQERRGVHSMGILFLVLSVSVAAGSVYRLVQGEPPASTLPGLILGSI